MAEQSRLPIVPMGLYGVRNIIPNGDWLVRPGNIEIVVGAPLCTEKWQTADLNRHMAEIRSAVEVCMAEAKRRYEEKHGITTPAGVADGVTEDTHLEPA